MAVPHATLRRATGAAIALLLFPSMPGMARAEDSAGGPKLQVDPVLDAAIVVTAASFAGTLELLISTGEIAPQQISPSFNRSRLLGVDRGALSQTIDSSAGTLSNVGLIVAGAYALVDPILSGLREHSVQTGLVDAVMYAESVATTWGLTNLAKFAVRRPRPQAYIDAENNKDNPGYANTHTDSALSFFSGHASLTAAIASTATYLAFLRDHHSARPWITLGVGTAVTTFVAIERVRSGAHFPTDVIVGSLVGAGVGVIVPQLHRTSDAKERAVWVGFGPQAGGGAVQVSGALF